MRRFITLLIWGLLLSPIVGLAQKMTDLQGQPAPAFELKSLAGTSVKAADLFKKNKITIVNFWATWCTSCVTEFPEMEKLGQKMKSQNISVIAINVEESPKEIQQAIQKIKISFPVLLDTKGEVKAAYSLMALPSTFLIDQQGVVQQQIVGGTTAQSLEDKIQKILKRAKN